METAQFHSYGMQTSANPPKESIRDMIWLQRDYPGPDKLFLEIFNTRVLLNEPIDIDEFS